VGIDIKGHVNISEFNSTKVPYFVLSIRGPAQLTWENPLCCPSSGVLLLPRCLLGTACVLGYLLSHAQAPRGRGLGHVDSEVCLLAVKKTVMDRANVLPLLGPQLKLSPTILRSPRVSGIEEKTVQRQKENTRDKVEDRGWNIGTNVCCRLQQ